MLSEGIILLFVEYGGRFGWSAWLNRNWFEIFEGCKNNWEVTVHNIYKK